ncbi:PRC-barrel domain-containing protein [Nodosilinea sp. P-1105]|uniref:PRC-barrel domain-containing protein n=1 Tax=Nodosilinea sp. P-1105 TaxID=2546229 RepID=UPI00146F5D9C|nr:PRC-barrel domain-containing protein [Nodosilinea sp. P-1105]NMF83214.1 photosystem reaction center subunit H [Nodosilinea sp. P-1105]
MTLDKYRLRSDFLGTQVITRNSGQRLGVVSQVWVDVDQREVVAIGLRENILSGLASTTQQIMPLSTIRQIGDVILVDDEAALDDEVNVAPYSTLVNCEVITETGEPLGRVRGFKFDVTNGRLETIVIASFGLPQIPDQVISTYELSVDEVVSSGPDRLIVFEGAEEKLVQLSMGLLERLGIGSAPWERNADSEYIMPVSTANQLPSGVQAPAEFTKANAPAAEQQWHDQGWGEPELVQEPVTRAQSAERYQAAALDQNDSRNKPVEPAYDADFQDVTDDIWSEGEEDKPYQAPPVNIPQRKKVTEYEEELDY